MAKGKLELISIIPGPKNVARLVQRFGKNEYGLVTSLSDTQLPMLRAELDDQTLVDVKSFGEVVRQVHQLTGLSSRRIATSRQILSALNIVCAEIDASSPFRKVADMPGFHECLLEVFREAGQWGLIGTDGEDLIKILKSHESLSKELRAKENMVILFEKYTQVIEHHQNDLKKMLIKLESGDLTIIDKIHVLNKSLKQLVLKQVKQVECVADT